MKIFDGERYDRERNAWLAIQAFLFISGAFFVHERAWGAAAFALAFLALFYAYRPRWKDYYVDKNS